jgi:hypothetical protein
MWQVRGRYANEEPAGVAILPEAFAARRFFQWSPGAGTFSLATPAAGAICDGATLTLDGGKVRGVVLRLPGQPVKVESGGAFAAGVELQCDSSGRAIALGAGVRLARSLEASGGSGEFVWCTFA